MGNAHCAQGGHDRRFRLMNFTQKYAPSGLQPYVRERSYGATQSAVFYAFRLRFSENLFLAGYAILYYKIFVRYCTVHDANFFLALPPLSSGYRHLLPNGEKHPAGGWG